MRSNRSIRRSREFRELRARGNRARRDGITVLARARPDPEAPSRVGLAVRASSGRAVDRNRIKRRLRAAARASLPAVGYDVIVRADDAVLGSDFQTMVSDLRAALHSTTRQGA
jgi:ribonuclease P protein component